MRPDADKLETKHLQVSVREIMPQYHSLRREGQPSNISLEWNYKLGREKLLTRSIVSDSQFPDYACVIREMYKQTDVGLAKYMAHFMITKLS